MTFGFGGLRKDSDDFNYVPRQAKRRTACEALDLTDDFDELRFAVPDFVCAFDVCPSRIGLLLFFFDVLAVAEADRLLDLLCDRVPLTFVLLPVDFTPLIADDLVKLAACFIKSWQKRSFSSLVIRSNLLVFVIAVEVIVVEGNSAKEIDQ